jgi:molybdopterin molybdotransferase
MALLPLDEAIDIVTQTALALRESHPPDTRVTTIWEASGFVIATDVRADRPMPPFDKSMMDGFAVRAADLVGASTELVVVDEIAAGEVPGREVGPGEAIAIMTGAPIPVGADAVVVVERTQREGERVIVQGTIGVGANIARLGSQVAEGEIVVERGRIIESLTAGVLASFGAHEVPVYRRPRMTVIATGDELVSVEETPGPAQIRDSNRKTLMALGEAEWCRVVDGGIAKDDRHELARNIRDGLDGDVLVLSGGVSAGSYDHVRECLEAEGVEILFHQIAIKPGKPVLFGRTARTLVFGLPGNPVSSYVTAMLLLVPAVRILGRRPDARSWYLDLPLVERGLDATQGRTTFHPADLVRLDGDALGVRPRAWDGSADHVAYARASVLIRRDPQASAAMPGEHVRVLMPRSLVEW